MMRDISCNNSDIDAQAIGLCKYGLLHKSQPSITFNSLQFPQAIQDNRAAYRVTLIRFEQTARSILFDIIRRYTLLWTIQPLDGLH